MSHHIPSEENEFDIAIIGMAGRFPGANSIDQFWQNLASSTESITFLTDEELKESGLDPAILNDPNYVKAAPVLEGAGMFDASFFGYSPREATFMDPQHRLFLECAWQALEHAGYNAETYERPIGVYGGAAMNTYLLFSGLLPNFVTEYLPTLLGNDNSFLTTRVSYKLNLNGPSMTVQTACSTALVAVHAACQSLLDEECDMALAGGVSVRVPQKVGHHYQEGSVFTPDGHCRAFDAKAGGTIFGSGVGIVVLKRLADAIADGDYIHAIIKGSAINNDGASKTDYTAPSVNSQSEAIVEAMANANIEADTISYIEAHGTGTYLGDPIEIAALTKAFRTYTDQKGFCAIGSVKTNIGHLDAAAGIAGLIKTVLALKHKQIPASLHFEEPNPEIDFANTPFYVNNTLSEWKSSSHPRRAGVTSLGMGGTNAHVVLEETPVIESSSSDSRPRQLLLLSAKTETALDTATTNLAEYLQQHPDVKLADVAYTLQMGRQTFNHRRFVVCQNRDDVLTILEKGDRKRVFTSYQEPINRDVVFMFSGQGAQYVNMGLGLYHTEPVFQEQLDLCAETLLPHLGFDLRDILYPGGQDSETAAQKLKQTYITQPALFAIEYALARLWMSWGVEPNALVGHSIGEYVAACLAGVFSLEDALTLVAARGRLMQQLPGGAMLAVPLSEQEIQPFLNGNLSLAVINSPSLCVVSGETEAINDLENQLSQQEITGHRLHTSHAFHSKMMDPILETFAEKVRQAAPNPPQIPFVSNVTGTWITPAEATDPRYWAKHLRQTVRFSDGVETLLKEPQRVLLEVGPGHTLSTLVRQHPVKNKEHVVLSSSRHPKEQTSDVTFILSSLGQLWLAGVQVDWSGFYEGETRQRLPLPSYPFERKRYWFEAGEQFYSMASYQRALSKKLDLADWLYLPSWQRSALVKQRQADKVTDQDDRWLLFVDYHYGLASQMTLRLQERGQEVITVKTGQHFIQHSQNSYSINPQQRQDYDALFEALKTSNHVPAKIVHFWSVTADDSTNSGPELFDHTQYLGFYSLLFLTQALADLNMTDTLQLGVISNHIQEVIGTEILSPEKATVLGTCKVIPQEYPNITCSSIDITAPAVGTAQQYKLINQLIAEFSQEHSDRVVAYRGNHRWVQTFEPVHWASPAETGSGVAEGTPRLRKEGVYLITGGLGTIGLIMAEFLAQELQAKLVLTGRSAFPRQEEWDQWLATHAEQDEVSRKIRQVQSLEKLGAQVQIFSADVADEAQMQAVIDQTCRQFGVIHGVIHAAGIVDTAIFKPIQETDQSECQMHFKSKVYGLYVLERVLRGRALDFCYLTSSLASILGGLGYTAYSAANLFMDTFVNKQNQSNPIPWISTNWDIWRLDEVRNQSTPATGVTLAELGITPDEGRQIFKRLLSIDAAQVAVSTGDLDARIDQWVKLESLPDAAESSGEISDQRQARPGLQIDYVAPRNEIEQTIAETWQDLLGIDQIGIHDNFTDLGGHSLLATQIISRLREFYHVKLSVRDLFNAATIAELAEYIQKQQDQIQDDTDKIARMLKKVEELGEDEISALLTKMKKP